MARLPQHPDEVRMSLGDHLMELRKRVILSLMAIGVAMIVCLFFSRPLVVFLSQPVSDAVRQIDLEARQHAADLQVPKGKTALRVEPIPADRPVLVSLTPMENFSTCMKAALLVGFIAASPFVFYQFWLFVGAGLYPHERRIVNVFVPFSVLLFVAGATFCYTIMLRYGLPMVLNFGGLADDIAKPTIRLSAAVSFVVSMSAVLGAVFQLPLVMMGLTRLGLVKSQFWLKYWRHSIVAIVLIAGIVTPTPDLFNQAACAVPMMILYWLGVLLAKIAEKKRTAAKAAYEKAMESDFTND
jgi:sec-independent protein translocase protein TatC